MTHPLTPPPDRPPDRGPRAPRRAAIRLPRSGLLRSLAAAVAVLSVTGAAQADDRRAGYMFPLREELLPDPVELRCGAVVQEYRGAAMDVAKLNRLCTHARVNFARFIKAKGLRPTHAGAFRWNLSFLPEGSCYRCLNDEEFRFRDRYYKGTLIGYSDLVYQYVFVFSDSHDADFALTFVHELFHAMSMFYGIYENHPGSWDEKNVIEERLAEDFTAWLGYGR